MSKLVIVESPTKAKTISKFLGRGFKVESSFGHVRDLPKRKLGVDLENNFEPQYVIPTSAKKTVSNLKKLAKKADLVYFATDEDREGEAITWHLANILKIDEEKIKRITFHEITPKAIKEALEHPRDVDMDMVDAQQARRVLDRLVGYKLSPLLWKKVAKGLSAGRVQSVAVRLIVEREREIQAFKKQEYWSVTAELDSKKAEGADSFHSKLFQIKDKKLEKFDIPDKKAADKILSDLDGAKYEIIDIKQKKTKKNPPTPYTTSTLQQDANRRLGWSAKQTMFVAQQLYEGIDLGDDGQVGLITYMRTDSVNLSEQFKSDAKDFITKEFGDKYWDGARDYKTKSKSAQEAHEAVRPTHANKSPESIASYLDQKQKKLYDLIWSRSVASQMTPAIVEATTIEIEANKHLFKATGSVIDFEGYFRVYQSSHKDEILPKVAKGDTLDLVDLQPTQHFTEPPARYSDASLVKALEEHGIGRPSTYAPTIATIIARNYVQKDGRRLIPTDIAYIVNDLLVENFSKVLDYEFTAHMEDSLDKVAEGKLDWQPVIKKFYEPFEDRLERAAKVLDKKEITEEETDEKCNKCGKDMVIKTGRFGKFLACTGFPDCRNTKALQDTDGDGKPEVVETDEKCEKCGEPMIIKVGRYGPFMSCSGYPDCKTIKSIDKKVGVKCTKCETGDIIERRSKRGRTFYGCSSYPKCDFALWSKPTGQKCPDCKSLIVHGAKNTIRCSNKECEYEPQEAPEPEVETENKE